MNELQVPELNTALVRRFGIRNRGPVSSLASEIQPVVVVGEVNGTAARTASGAVVFAVGIGVSGGLQLFNPLGSGCRVKVDRIVFTGQIAGATYSVMRADTSLATDVSAGNKGFTNREINPTGVPVAQLRAQATPPGLGPVYTTFFDNLNEFILFPVDHVLIPGTGIAIFTPVSGVAYTANCCYDWTEVLDEPEK